MIPGNDKRAIETSKTNIKQKLQASSQHMHISVLCLCLVGSNTYGLLEALPHDMMHAFLHGVVMYVLEVIMSPLDPSEKFIWMK